MTERQKACEAFVQKEPIETDGHCTQDKFDASGENIGDRNIKLKK